ncbi:MAG: PEP-CTERM sorting domain-containing protein [Planctomycetia bacterium]|nr:PEP-CTERM sorting domain-containing protein [Planctomycetia bacterium]
MMRTIGTMLVLTAFLSGPSLAGTVPIDDFNDIVFWAGSGSEASAFILQFNDDLSPESVAWGYRWDSAVAPKFSDMLFALAGEVTGGPAPVAGSDPRLSIDLGYYEGLGFFLNSLTYRYDGLPADWPQVDRQIEPYDSETGFYAAQYQLDNAAGTWSNTSFNLSAYGISSTPLVAGGWYGFVPADGSASMYAFTQPVAAVPEPSSIVLLVGGLVAGVAMRRVNRRGVSRPAAARPARVPRA